MAEDMNCGFDVSLCSNGDVMLSKGDFSRVFSSYDAAYFLHGYATAIKQAEKDQQNTVGISIDIDTSAALKAIREIESAADEARHSIIRLEEAHDVVEAKHIKSPWSK